MWDNYRGDMVFFRNTPPDIFYLCSRVHDNSIAIFLVVILAWFYFCGFLVFIKVRMVQAWVAFTNLDVGGERSLWNVAYLIGGFSWM